jgi:sugar/nucleoside kinase (ribokinase family)
VYYSPTRILEQSLVGGVTLNHLAWAAALGVPASLLALQGDDPSGRYIRSSLSGQYGVDTSFVQVNKEYTTSECFVFIQRDGERSIVMAPSATSFLDGAAVDRFFAGAVRDHAFMVSSEISQVPHSGVLRLLRTARSCGITSVLDLDVSPRVAVNEANLGSLEDLLRCVHTVDILKPARHAAEELLSHLQSDSSNTT